MKTLIRQLFTSGPVRVFTTSKLLYKSYNLLIEQMTIIKQLFILEVTDNNIYQYHTLKSLVPWHQNLNQPIYVLALPLLHFETNHSMLYYRLLNVYCEVLGTSSYGAGRTSLRVRLHHCRIFHNIHSRTFLLYTFNINLLVSSQLCT